MKILLLIISLTLLMGCTTEEDQSDSIHIVSQDASEVLIEGLVIYVHEHALVKDVIARITSDDGSHQNYAGVTNGRTLKRTDFFNEHEYVMVISESGVFKAYYEIRFFTP